MDQTKSIAELAENIESAMIARGQSLNRVSQYHYVFKVFIAYSKTFGETGFSADIIERCLDEHYGIKDLTAIVSRRQHYRKLVIRAYKMLRDYAEGKPFADRYNDYAPLAHSDEYMDAAALFFDECERKGLAQSTIRLYGCEIGKLFAYCEERNVFSFAEWNLRLINEHLHSYSGCKQITIKGVTNDLSRFCKYLYLNQYTSEDFGEKIDRVKTRHQTKIPSAWSQENVFKLLAAVDRGNPSGKRDYAILLFVTRLGLRVGDITRLKFENIDWQNNRITLIQSKTSHPICLPLLKDVGWALIDYIQHGRPKHDSPYVFLTHITPIKEISAENHLYELVKKHVTLARITPVPKQKMGMH